MAITAKPRGFILGSGLKMRAGAYVRLWRQVKILAAEGDGDIPCDLCCAFSHRSLLPAQDVLGQFRDGLHERINRRDPRYGQGRKWSYDYEKTALRVAQAIRDRTTFRRRLRAVEWRWLPPELHRAIAPLLDHDSD